MGSVLVAAVPGEGGSGRLLPLDELPQPHAGEVTDKRSINARRVLERRSADVARLYADLADPAVIG